MLAGLNYPWMNYGWDFGVPPPGWRSPVSWQDDISAQLPHWRKLGVSVVRWFILADGLNLSREHSLDAAFLDDFACMLGSFSPEVQVLPVLLDFPTAFPALDARASEQTLQIWRAEGEAPRLPYGYFKGGRSDIFNDPAISRQFVQGVLDPLLEISRAYRENVFAWEVINEPEWIVRRRRLGRTWGGLPEHAKVSAASMAEFFRVALARIASEGFSSTIGFTCARMLSAWTREIGPLIGDLDGFLPQHHYYPGPQDYLEALEGSTILGEFSTRQQEGDDNPHARSWPELPPGRQSLSDRLTLAAERGYSLALPWSYRARDAASGPWEETRAALESRQSIISHGLHRADSANLSVRIRSLDSET
jgi:hypothetical protein